MAWSSAAETALVDAYRFGWNLGRGAVRFDKVRLGGPKVRKARARCADHGDGAQVLYRERSVALLVELRRRLRAVLDEVGSICRSGFSVAGDLELPQQWEKLSGMALKVLLQGSLVCWSRLVPCMMSSISFCISLWFAEGFGRFRVGDLGFWRILCSTPVGGFGLTLSLPRPSSAWLMVRVCLLIPLSGRLASSLLLPYSPRGR